MSNLMEVAFTGIGTEVNTFRVRNIHVDDDGMLVMDKVDSDGTIVGDPDDFLGIVTTLTF